MTIGLYQLNADGSGQDAAPTARRSTPTRLDDVTNLARVFTGYDLDIATADKGLHAAGRHLHRSKATPGPRGRWRSPPAGIRRWPPRFLGTTVAGGNRRQGGAQDRARHALQPPQRRALHRQAADPAAGHQQPEPRPTWRASRRCSPNNGAGVRGDMKSVLRRRAARQRGAQPGRPVGPRLRPAARADAALRAVGPHLRHRLHAAAPGRSATSRGTANQLGQSPLRSPSVFNFFRPGYVPPSAPRSRRRRAWSRRSSSWSTRPRWAAT